MMFLTTTSPQPDAELQNRCLTLRVDESPGQTEAIHARQRAAYTLEGRLDEERRQQILRLHQNAQRLLEPLPVTIPRAGRLRFRHDQTRMRRDHAKYLALIAAAALLHQHQRPRKTHALGKTEVVYVEAAPQDVALANRLMSCLMGQSLDALLPQTRQLLGLIDDHVGRLCRKEKRPRQSIRFTQRELREQLGWGDFPLRRHLARLVDLEYVLAYRTGHGNQRHYGLLYDGQGRRGEPFLLGLADPEELTGIPQDE